MSALACWQKIEEYFQSAGDTPSGIELIDGKKDAELRHRFCL
jgi:hypothetical protein